MHILFIPAWFETPDRPTAGKAVKDLAFALVLEGIKVNILFQSKAQLPYFSKIQHQIEVWHSSFFLPGKFYPIWNWFSLWAYHRVFKKYIEKSGLPDLIHIHSYPLLPIARYLKKKYNIPFVYTEHSSKINSQKINRFEEYLIKYYLEGDEHIIAVSSFLKAGLLSLIPHHSIRIIPNTIDFNYFIPGSKVSPPEFIMVNLLNQNKQVDKGIKAFALWTKQYPDSKLHIIGDGPEKPDLLSLAEKLSIQNQIVWWGEKPVQDWLPILQGASGLLFLSKLESFGVVVVEALACGVPVVVMENKGIDDIVEATEISLLPVDADEISIADKMNELTKFYSKSTLLKWREKLKSKFDYPVIAGKYIEVYQAILNSEKKL